jgi:hypothetical protein
MTNRNRWLRWIAAILIALALLAVVAWRNENDSSRESRVATTPASRTATATVADSSDQRAAATSTMAASTVAAADAGNMSALKACDLDFRRNSRGYRDQLGPARSADEAIDRLLLDFVATDPSEWMSGELGDEYRAASERWSNDVDLAWLALDFCNVDCDRDAHIRHLLSVDPDNAAAWMVAMDTARQQKDQHGFDSALREASRAKIYDPRIGVAFLHLRRQLAHVPRPDSCQGQQWNSEMQRDLGRAPTDADLLDSMAGAVEMGIALPSFSGLSGCKDTAWPLTEKRRKRCIALLSRVATGDTLIEQMLANVLLIKLQPDAEKLARLRERYRQLRWLMSIAQQKPFPENHFARMYADGEVDMLQTIALERGQWPPPPDWLPDDPRSHALITGEPPP